MLLCIAVFTSIAQVKVSKTFLIGKWQVANVEMTSHSKYIDRSYYDVEKDFFSISSTDTITPKLIALGVIDSAERYNSSKKDFTKAFIKDGKVLFYVYNPNDTVITGFSTKESGYS